MRRLGIVAVGLALVVGLAAGCGGDGELPDRTLGTQDMATAASPSGQADVEEPLAAGWTRRTGDTWTIGLPATWEDYPLEGFTIDDLESSGHPLLTKAVEAWGRDAVAGYLSQGILVVAVDSSSPTLSLVVGGVPGGPPTIPVREGLDEMARIDRDAGISVVSEDTSASAGPYDAGILEVYDPTSGFHQLKYLVRVPEVGWFWIVFTYFSPEEEFDPVLFQQIVDSFRAST